MTPNVVMLMIGFQSLTICYDAALLVFAQPWTLRLDLYVEFNCTCLKCDCMLAYLYTTLLNYISFPSALLNHNCFLISFFVARV